MSAVIYRVLACWVPYPFTIAGNENGACGPGEASMDNEVCCDFVLSSSREEKR